MAQPSPHCPNCLSQSINRNGFNDRGTQSYKCKDCGRRFVLTPKCFPLTQSEKALLERLLLERISLAGIARVMERSESCIQSDVNAKAKTVPKTVEVTKQVKGVMQA